MSIFSENIWEADAVGDKLSKQLFRKITKTVNKNRSLNSSVVSKKELKRKSIKKNEQKPSEISNVVANKTDNDNGLSKKKRKRKTNKDQKNNTKKSKVESTVKAPDNYKKEAQTKMKPKKNVPTTSAESSIKDVKNTGNSNNQINLNRIEKMLLLKKTKKSQDHEPGTLRERMMTQLRASRFRYLNETLYNNESSESRKMFKEDPDAFNAYHTGYRQQVEQWPLNPLDIIIASIKKMPKDNIIADFGCGEARLANSVEQKVHSLDLVAINDKVIACDMAHTQLLTQGIHVVVFCLSLMGSNLADYLLEANRVLKINGILKIADIESRFENIDEFIESMEIYGFKNTWKDLSNNLFYFMDFKKVAEVNRRSKNLPRVTLKSCLYKKR